VDAEGNEYELEGKKGEKGTNVLEQDFFPNLDVLYDIFLLRKRRNKSKGKAKRTVSEFKFETITFGEKW